MKKETLLIRKSFKMNNLLASALVVLTVLAVASPLTVGAEQTGNNMMERQGRSVSGNSHNKEINNGANSIDINSQKAKIELEKREVQNFLTTKNILKSIMKLLFGTQEEVGSTSRHVLGVLEKVLNLLKNTFGQKARSHSSARTLRDSAEDALSAGVSILQGYVKSVLSNDENCVRRHVCQANADALRDGRDAGFIVATLGSFASNYLLDNNLKPTEYKSLHQAASQGRTPNANCTQLYPCTEDNRAQL